MINRYKSIIKNPGKFVGNEVLGVEIISTYVAGKWLCIVSACEIVVKINVESAKILVCNCADRRLASDLKKWCEVYLLEDVPA